MNDTVGIVNKVLDILLDPNTDFKAIVYQLARQDPEALIRLTGKNDLMFPELRMYCESGQKIPAIKYVRSVAKMGLKDAKEFVEDYIAMNNIQVQR
jgi:hypothetical protein